MINIAQLHPMNIGIGFRAYSLRGGEMVEAFALSIEPWDVPIVKLPGVKVRVPLGSFGEARSMLQPPTEVCLLDISLDEGANLSTPVLTGHSAFIMPIFGTLEINGEPFDANEPRLSVFPAQATSREVKSTPVLPGVI